MADGPPSGRRARPCTRGGHLALARGPARAQVPGRAGAHTHGA
jgi:hypothetical protein